MSLDLFGWLTHQEWLSILRIGIGLWWLESVRHKPLKSFLRGSSMGWVESQLKDHPVRVFANTIEKTSLQTSRRRIVTSWLVVLGELSVGISLVLGLFTPVGLVVALFLNANYLLLAGLRDQGEQGQNLVMLLTQSVLLLAASWRVWALDTLLWA